MAPPEGGRLLTAPVFILSPARAGSTLLRMILGSHSTMYAPPELPLRQMTVRAETPWTRASMNELQLARQELDYLLWDRVLADVLARGGKPTLVAKTPSNVLIWQQIAEPEIVTRQLCATWGYLVPRQSSPTAALSSAGAASRRRIRRGTEQRN